LNGERRREGGSRRKEAWARRLSAASRIVLGVLLFSAPLLAGSVHTATATAVLAASLLSLLTALGAILLRDRNVVGASESHLAALLIGLTLLQLVPLPQGLRAHVQANGTALLENAPGGLPAHWPLSLDPLATERELAVAGAALAVFLLALRLSAGRARFTILARAIALSGAVALVSGLIHRLLGLRMLYGLFPVNDGLLMGPMINPNHSAELYELAGFAALALLPAATGEARLIWGLVAACNLAASLATLSRGALLGVLAGLGAYALLRERDDDGPTGRRALARRGVAWFVFASALIGALALSLGAGSLWAKLSSTDLGSVHEKTSLWKDSLALTRLFPTGIGRHAFDVVYPAFKTLPLDIRFAFAENGPLQLLVDLGWVGFAMVLASTCVTGYRLLKDGPRDDSQAALLAGLVAVLAHNLADFGLEIAGLRLPFAALAGAALGRTWRLSPRPQPARWQIVAPALAVVAIGIGLLGYARPDRRDYEARWRSAPTREARQAVAVAAAERFPTDYYFPLLQSFSERLSDPSSPGRSPKIAALNRSLRLCPSCQAVHREVARVMFEAGRRSQALSVWQQIVRLGPAALPDALNVLRGWNYSPAEIATLADVDGVDLLLLARQLIAWGARSEAAEVVARARSRGLPGLETDLLDGDLALSGPQPDRARPLLDRLVTEQPGDPRPHALISRLEERSGHLERALAEARQAALLAPRSPDLARRWVDLVSMTETWDQLQDALSEYQTALRLAGQTGAAGFLYAGQINETRGNPARALSEYRAAAVSDPGRAETWAAIARMSEAQGDLSGAINAFERLLAITHRAQDRDNLERLRQLRKEAEVRALLR
jgi:tetratricopeptide (TPR) repeat protein